MIVTPAQIPPIVKEAVVSIEDKRFWSDGGVDPRGIAARAARRRHARQQPPGRLDDRGAVHQERALGPVAPDDPREASRGRARLPALAALAEAEDPRGVPEHDLFRQRRVRHRGRGADLLRPRSQPPGLRDRRTTSCASKNSSPGRRRCSPASSRTRPPTTRSTSPRRPRNAATPCSNRCTSRATSPKSDVRTSAAPGAARADRDPAAAAPDRRRRRRPATSRAGSQQQVVERYGAPRAYAGGLQVKTTLDLQLQRAAENAVNAYLAEPRGPDRLDGRDRKLDRRGARDGRRAQLRRIAVQPRDRGRAPAGLLLQGLRPRRGAQRRHLARTRSGRPTEKISHRPRRTRASKRFVVHNDEGSYTGANTLLGATDALRQLDLRRSRAQGRHRARSPQLAHEMGITTPLSTNAAMTIGGLKVGVTPLDMAHAYETIAQGGRRVERLARRRGHAGRHPGSAQPRRNAAGRLARRSQPRREPPGTSRMDHRRRRPKRWRP